MKNIRAVYENGVFRPLEPVDLPEHTPVVCEPQPQSMHPSNWMEGVYEVLSRRHRSGHRDTAQRHNEHQP